MMFRDVIKHGDVRLEHAYVLFQQLITSHFLHVQLQQFFSREDLRVAVRLITAIFNLLVDFVIYRKSKATHHSLKIKKKKKRKKVSIFSLRKNIVF
jgi:hypothetical protein